MEREKKYASRNALRITNITVIVLIIIVLLFWWRGYSIGGTQLKGVSPDQISIRQNDGQIQYQFLNGEWQNIASVADLKGEKGDKGQDGSTGRDGSDGKNGTNGKDGVNGVNGKDGVNGRNGTNGKDGKSGDKGDKGDRGEKGETGLQGAQGEKGDKGETGAQGAKGDKGGRGEKGDTGAKGADGQDGVDGREIELRKDSLYIQWRYKGDTNWNNLIAYSDLKGEKGDKGDTGAQGEKGLKGDTGEQGAKGETGAQGAAGVGIPQTLSLNDGVLTLSNNGGSVTLPKTDNGAISKFPLTAYDSSKIFASGRMVEEFQDGRNYMVINNETGQGFIHLDFWAKNHNGASIGAMNIPGNAPKIKYLSEVQAFDGGTSWVEANSKVVRIQKLKDSQRYIINIPVFVDPISK